jgi:hypothetical protein
VKIPIPGLLGLWDENNLRIRSERRDAAILWCLDQISEHDDMWTLIGNDEFLFAYEHHAALFKLFHG